MIFSYAVIIITLIVLFRLYSVNYTRGFQGSLFLLILMPDTIAISFSAAIPTFSIHRIILIFMFLKWINNEEIRSRLDNVHFLRILIIFTIFTGISAIISSNFLVSAKRFLYFVFESLIFYVIVATSIKDKNDAIILVKTVAASLAVVSFLGIIENITGFNPSTLFPGNPYYYEFRKEFILASSDKGSIGIESTYDHRILFGIGMAIAQIYFLFLINRATATVAKIIYWLLIFLTGYTLYFSMSRGPWLALILCLIFLSTFSPKTYLKITIIFTMIALTAMMLRPGTVYTIQRMAKSTVRSDTIKGSSFRWRFAVLDMAYSQVMESKSLTRFLFGFGQGSRHFMEFPYVRLSTGHYATFHSWDMEFAVILLEHGFVGIFLLLYLYFRILTSAFSHYRMYTINREIMLFASGCLLIIIFMKTNVKIFAPQIVYLEFISIALISLLLSTTTDKPSLNEPI